MFWLHMYQISPVSLYIYKLWSNIKFLKNFNLHEIFRVKTISRNWCSTRSVRRTQKGGNRDSGGSFLVQQVYSESALQSHATCDAKLIKVCRKKAETASAQGRGGGGGRLYKRRLYAWLLRILQPNSATETPDMSLNNLRKRFIVRRQTFFREGQKGPLHQPLSGMGSYLRGYWFTVVDNVTRLHYLLVISVLTPTFMPLKNSQFNYTQSSYIIKTLGTDYISP